MKIGFRTGRVKVWLRGGLGNQLFQYSYGIAISQATGKELELKADLLPLTKDEISGISRWPQQLSMFQHSGKLLAERHQPASGTNFRAKFFSVFELLVEKAPLLFANLGHFGEKSHQKWLKLSVRLPVWMNIYCMGYFIVKDYARKAQAQLRSEFLSLRRNNRALDERCQELSETIAIHVRLGDFLVLNPTLHNEYSDFFTRALEVLGGSNAKLRFTLFSDEAHGAKTLMDAIGYPNLEVFDDYGMSPAEVLICMSSCSGLVANPSTFAWWGAFLQGDKAGPVIFRTPWSQSQTRDESAKVYLENWIQVGIQSQSPID